MDNEGRSSQALSWRFNNIRTLQTGICQEYMSYRHYFWGPSYAYTLTSRPQEDIVKLTKPQCTNRLSLLHSRSRASRLSYLQVFGQTFESCKSRTSCFRSSWTREGRLMPRRKKGWLSCSVEWDAFAMQVKRKQRTSHMIPDTHIRWERLQPLDSAFFLEVGRMQGGGKQHSQVFAPLGQLCW